MLFVSCVSHVSASVHCCLVVTCWEGTDLLALVGDVYCNFVTFPYGILGQVWYLTVSFPDLCRLSYFQSTPLYNEFIKIVAKKHQMRAKSRIYHFPPKNLINSITHEHYCKISYHMTSRLGVK